MQRLGRLVPDLFIFKMRYEQVVTALVWSRGVLNFDFLETGLSPRHFVRGFSRKIFITVYSFY